MPPNVPKPSAHVGASNKPKSTPERDIDLFNDDDYDETPLQHLRPFGAGLYKQPMINFVPANENLSLSNPHQPEEESKQPSIAEMYLALVSKPSPSPSVGSNTDPTNTHQTEVAVAKEDSQSEFASSEPTTLCEVCKIQVPSAEMLTHITSIPHQSRLPHSHPPSGLDRTRMGLAVLSNQGWDPDSRKGLGAAQQGIQFPLKPKPKEDKLGIGLKPPAAATVAVAKITEKKIVGRGQARKLYKEEKRRAARIRMELSGDDKLERYLSKGSLDQPVGRQLQLQPPGRGIHFDFSKKK
ncbi:hypothetical protein V8F20_002562 [Naviculisporaceae sp. PSN 640]